MSAGSSTPPGPHSSAAPPASAGAGALDRSSSGVAAGWSGPSSSPAPALGLRGRVAAVRARARSTRAGALAWRIGVTVVGVATLVVGVILLPLPGPGWVIIFAGLGLLASEYAWAAALLARVRSLSREWARWMARQPRWVAVLIGAATVAVVAAILWGGYVLLYR